MKELAFRPTIAIAGLLLSSLTGCQTTYERALDRRAASLALNKCVVHDRPLEPIPAYTSYKADVFPDPADARALYHSPNALPFEYTRVRYPSTPVTEDVPICTICDTEIRRFLQN